MAEFGLNYKVLALINTTPETTATLARIGKGIVSFVGSNEETSDSTAYLDLNGFLETDVTGKQRIYTAAGHRYYGDAAQDYIASKSLALGSELRTNIEFYKQDGTKQTAAVTITELQEGGGDANAKMDFGFVLRCNGKPVETPPTAAPDISETVAAGSVAGTTKFTVTPGAGNTLAYKLTSVALTANANSYPSVSLVTYTSGADIPATVGQILNAYELNQYGRVVKFATHTLVTADVNGAT
jgi:hypothetical protein